MGVELGTLLCAIDFSELSHLAIRCGVDLSRQIGARLVVFHSVPCPQDWFQGAAVFRETQDGRQAARRALEKIETLMGAKAPYYKPAIAFGDPVEEVQRVADVEDAHLIVSAIRGLSGFKRMLIGTVVERMARTLSQPLLTVRQTKASMAGTFPGSFHLRQIVVGCDLLHGTRPAIAYAHELARRCDAVIHLLHTIEAPADDDLPDAPMGPYGQVQQAQRDRLQDRLADLFPQAPWGTDRHTIALAYGIPGEALAAYASRIGADLIVVGVRPRRGLERMLAGSTTEAMLRHGPCPVMTVRADAVDGQTG